MSNFWVVVDGNSSDGFRFRIEDVASDDPQTFLPSGLFVEYADGILSASSVEQLKARLQQLLVACDKPVLYVTQPELKVWSGWKT